MRVIQFPEGQGSQAWLDWRKSRVTATDASVIDGCNPFMNIDTLWKQKFDIIPGPAMNERMKRGQLLEPIARGQFIEQFGIEIEPVCIEHEIDWWHGSSLDGIDSTGKIIVEIKSPNFDTHELAISGSIKPYYMCQIQHQFYTSGAEICFYVSYNPEHSKKIHIIEVMPNLTYISDLVSKEKQFYEINMCQWRVPIKEWTLATK